VADPAVRALLLVVLLAIALTTACGGDDKGGLSEGMTFQEALKGDSTGTTPAPPPTQPSSTPALAAYQEAKQAVGSGDLEGARSALNRAVESDPQFAEAWYQLGATETNLAIQWVNDDEGRAVQLFRDGVDHKRTAEGLMRQGSYRVWTPAQQEQSWEDLQQGLEGVDELLADEATLVQALRMYAAGAR